MLLSMPKSVTIAGIEIEIIQDDRIFEESRCLGRAYYGEQCIRIATGVIPEDTAMQVFYHELIHFIFNIYGYKAHQNDEHLVDLLAASLWQAEKFKVPIDITNVIPKMD